MNLPSAAYAVLEAIAEQKAEREAIQAEAPLHEGNGKPAARNTKAGGGGATVESRAVAYLDKCDPAVSGRGGHDTTFGVACRVGPGFDLAPSVALGLIRGHYNPRCEPPWSDAELVHKVDDAYKVEPRRGWLKDQPAPSRVVGPLPSSNGHANGKPQDPIDYASLTDEELGLVEASGIKEAVVEWLWEYRLARGEMALMAGEGGLGKSQVLLAIAAAISNGSDWPDGSGKAPLGRVVILSAEDSPETTIKPRLMALGANLDNITICKAKVIIERDGKRMVSHVSLQDCGYWQTVFNRRPNTVLFIVDPLPSYLGRGVNDQRNNEIREVLEPFIEEVLRPRGICMFANTHLNKSIDIKTPVHRITGSIAYGNIPRNVHFVVRDPEKPERRYFKQCKCNNAPDELPALAFRVEKRTVPSEAGDIETAIPVFEDKTVNVDLSSLLNGDGKRRGPKPIKTDKLAVWLFDYLNERREPVQAGPLHDAAALAFASEVPNPLGEKGDDGLWTNGRNLKRAAERIPFLESPRNGKKVERLRDMTTNRWHWQLVDAD